MLLFAATHSLTQSYEYRPSNQKTSQYLVFADIDFPCTLSIVGSPGTIHLRLLLTAAYKSLLVLLAAVASTSSWPRYTAC